MSDAVALFGQTLEDGSGKKLKLRINNNRSTMLSVRWEPDHVRVSVHKMFLDAPKNVMDALACYIRREDKTAHPIVKSFIENNLKNFDYSKQVKREELFQQGVHYDIRALYDEVNEHYFARELDLNITWFGEARTRALKTLTLGLYHDPLKLIKIHRKLDSPFFPESVVRFVIYHEMLHHVCPPYYDENGRHRIHTPEFKRREAEFEEYAMVQDWIGHHRSKLFSRI